jgi:hypothetical protein
MSPLNDGLQVSRPACGQSFSFAEPRFDGVGRRNTSFDAIATVRLLGRYTLAGLTIPARDQLSSPHEVASPNE